MRFSSVLLALALAAAFATGASAQTVRTFDLFSASLPASEFCATPSGCVVSDANLTADPTLCGAATPPGCAGNPNVDCVCTFGDDEDTVILDGPLFAAGGGEIVINPGVTLRGQPRSGPVVTGDPFGTPGALVVTQDGTIQAIGTPSPTGVIVMTTAATDNDGDGVADDFDGNGFEDQWPGYSTAGCFCPDNGTPDPNPGTPGDAEELDDCVGSDGVLGTSDDFLGTAGGTPVCTLGAGSFLDASPRTAPLAPLNSAGDPNVALWGGVVINGEAPTNLAGSSGSGQFGTGLVEGLTVPGYPTQRAIYGGVQPHDNSGNVQYVSVRHAGDELGDGNELNGVTLAGVGDGTTFRFNEVYANFDDGFEWFGGTVNWDHLHVLFAGDDQLDVDQGYTGVGQFALTVTPFFNPLDCVDLVDNDSGTAPPDGECDGNSFGSLSGDRHGEFDGDDCIGDCNDAGRDSINDLIGGSPEAATVPLHNNFVFNWTALGNNLNSMESSPGAPTVRVVDIDFDPNVALCDGAPDPVCCTGIGTGVCTTADNEGVRLRNGFAGEIINSLLLNAGSEENLNVAPPSGGGVFFDVDDNICQDYDGEDGANGDDDNGDLIRFRATTLDDGAAIAAWTNGPTGPASAPCGTQSDESQVLENGDAITGSGLGVVAGNIVNNVPFFGLLDEDTTFDPQGLACPSPGTLCSALKASPINPRPSVPGPGIVPVTSTENLPVVDPAFGQRGAFLSTDPAGGLWTEGWTVLDISGLMD